MRLVFDDKAPEGGGVPEAKKDAPKGPDKKPAGYTLDDLKKSRTDAEQKLIQKIKHPGVQAEAKTELAGKLNPLEEKLAKLEAEKTDEQNVLKQQVDSAVRDVLDAQRNFAQMTVAFGGQTYEFMVNPEAQMDQYEAMQQRAQDSLLTFSTQFNKVKGGEVEGTPQLINGIVICKVILDRERVVNGKKEPIPNLAEGAYKDVTIEGTKIVERYSDPVLEDKQTDAVNFQSSFEQWKASPDATFTYGEPPKTFPPSGFDMTKFLNERQMQKSELKIDHFLEMKMPEVVDLDAPLKTQTYEFKKMGTGLVFGSTVIDNSHLLSPNTEVLAQGPDFLQTRSVEFRIVNQQRRKIEVITDYWPRKLGETNTPKLKKIEEYEDGVVTSQTRFDAEGKLLERVSKVKGCTDASSVDRPLGPPYKEAQVLDDHGKAVLDENGKPLMERISTREFILKDEKGKEKVRIRTFQAENEYRKAQGQKPMSEDEYTQMLGKNLQSDEQIHAFTSLMFKYRYDDASKNDTWQRPGETFRRTENGLFLGDCEDYAFVLQKILQAQGKKAYVLSLPGHAECITISRDEKGKYHAKSYGTFGVDVDGNRIGESIDPSKSEGYETPEFAMRALQKKWSFKESGNAEMEDGDPLSQYKRHPSITKAMGVMSFESDAKADYFSSMMVISSLQFDAEGKAKGSDGRMYSRGPDGFISDIHGTKFKLGLDNSVTDTAGNKYKVMNDGRLEDAEGNRYQLLEGGHIGKFSPVKLTDDAILSPHGGVKPAEAGGEGKADKAPVAAPKEASAPAQKSVEDTPEMKEAKAQISSAARSALASFVSKSYEDLAAIPNLAATIAAEVTSRVKALNSDVIAFVPLVKGAIVVQTNKGNVAVSGTVAYAKRLLATKEGQSKDKVA
jgi:hypothetical protein